MTFERTILVGVDGSAPSRDALVWACQLAQVANLNVRAVMAWHFPPGLDHAGSVEETSAVVTAQLAEVTAGCPCDHLELQTVQGLALTGLVGAASEPDVALLAMGKRGLGTVPDLLLGSVARGVLHNSPVPVALVPTQPLTGFPYPGRIVAGIDGSQMSRSVIDFVALLAEDTDVSATVVQCIDIGAEFSPERLEEVTLRTSHKTRSDWCGPLDEANVVYTIDVHNDDPRTGLRRAIERNGAGTVIIGLHGAGQVRGIGGTTFHLARHLDVPLVVVPLSSSTPTTVGYRL